MKNIKKIVAVIGILMVSAVSFSVPKKAKKVDSKKKTVVVVQNNKQKKKTINKNSKSQKGKNGKKPIVKKKSVKK